MARIPPETAVAGASLVGGMAAKGSQLAVGHPFAGHGNRPYQQTGDIPGAPAHIRLGGDGEKRQAEQNHQQGLPWNR